MSIVTLECAGRGLADIGFQEWRLQSPLKWNYGALHSSVTFERLQQYTKGSRCRQLENDSDTQDYRYKETVE